MAEFFTEINKIMGPGTKAKLGGDVKGAVRVCQTVIAVATEAMLQSVAWQVSTRRCAKRQCRVLHESTLPDGEICLISKGGLHMTEGFLSKALSPVSHASSSPS